MGVAVLNMEVKVIFFVKVMGRRGCKPVNVMKKKAPDKNSQRAGGVTQVLAWGPKFKSHYTQTKMQPGPLTSPFRK
jgi:hypothetical protein